MATGGYINTQQYIRVSDIANEPQTMLMPIRGYEKMPLVSLEETVTPLMSILPEVKDYAFVAKQRCKPVPANGLTQDQSASIILYTMEWEPHEECLYFALNATLRAEDRRKLKPWFSYLKLILTALKQLPSTRQSVYRGVKMNLIQQYPLGKTFVWWGFSSCASKMGVLENEQFLGKTGDRTMFSIDCESGKDISRHSYFQSEDEILLLPARQFEVISCLQPAAGLNMIQLKETQSPISLLQPVTSDSHPKASSQNIGIKTQPETIAVSSVQPKLDSVKIGSSNSTVPKPMAMHKTITHHATSKNQEFAAPGTCKELFHYYSFLM
ncbi:unnamed protein product [Rotaria sordida]|uniref:NAD(P)(+)--arginine ADP-ribosyltransferase n=1 Tax=Rotaria sordida TaxID=392033 RepID=A0A814XD45_9BILA|nr:unnamed protein product [Rotaria sordida]CAF1494148.1 unnamed protein product [Rotaria sordida]